MAKFTDDKDQKKWDSLSGTTTKEVTNLLKGTATNTDLTKLGGLVSDYDDLAKSVYETGLANMNKLADKLTEDVKQKRKNSKKLELTEGQLIKLQKRNRKQAQLELGPALIDMFEELKSKSEETAQAVNSIALENESGFSIFHNLLGGKYDKILPTEDVNPKTTKRILVSKKILPKNNLKSNKLSKFSPASDFFTSSEDEFDEFLKSNKLSNLNPNFLKSSSGRSLTGSDKLDQSTVTNKPYLDTGFTNAIPKKLLLPNNTLVNAAIAKKLALATKKADAALILANKKAAAANKKAAAATLAANKKANSALNAASKKAVSAAKKAASVLASATKKANAAAKRIADKAIRDAARITAKANKVLADKLKQDKIDKAKQDKIDERNNALLAAKNKYNNTKVGAFANALHGQNLKTKKNSYDLDEFKSTLLSKVLQSLTSKKLINSLDPKNKKNYAIGTTANTTFGFSEKTDAAFLKAYRAGAATDKDLSNYIKHKNKVEALEEAKVKGRSKKDKTDSDSYLSKIGSFLKKDIKPKNTSDFVGDLMNGLGVLLLSTKLLSSVGSMVGEYFSVDSVKDTLSSAFDLLTDKVANIGSSIVEKVKEFFGIKTEPESVKSDTNETSAESARLASKEAKAANNDNQQKGTKNNASVTSKAQQIKGQSDQTSNSSASDNSENLPNDSSNPISPTTVADNLISSTTNNLGNTNSTNNNENYSNEGRNSSVDNSVTSSASKSTIGDTTSSTSYGGSSTQISAMNQAPFNDGITVEPQINNQTYSNSEPTTSQTAGPMPINLSSFNFKAGIDDRLLILNAGLIG